MIMVSPCYALMLTGDTIGGFLCAVSNILPMGLAWVLIGIVIWGAVKINTKGYEISGIIFILYLAMLIPTNLIPVSVQPFMALIVGVSLAIMIIMIITKKG